jgi:tannase
MLPWLRRSSMGYAIRKVVKHIPGAEFEDAATTYDSTADTWGLDIAGTGGEWVGRFLELQDVDNLSTLDNLIYDTLVD